jgi:hypothetical protein
MKLEYTKDICGNDILQDETGQHQVMMEWEKPYMEACIDKLDISGSVLEIGFGLGYSANRICSSPNITEYTVVECSPVVWEKVEEFKKKKSNLKINLIKGRWQDVLCTCKKYDRCFFDDYIHDINNPDRLSKFLSDFLSNHANINCIIGSFSWQYLRYDYPFITMECERYNIDIPFYCKYAKGNKLYINKMIKIRELLPEEINLFKTHKTSIKLQENSPSIPTIANMQFSTVQSCSVSYSNINTYKEIEDLYLRKTDMNKLDKYCGEYLHKNTANNRQQRMIKFYQAYANFYSDPKKSKEIFSSLLENPSLEDDIKGWTNSNLLLI